MFERSKASLAKLETTVESTFQGVRSKVIGVRHEVESFDQGVMSAIDRVGAVVQGAEARVVGELSTLKARIEDLTPKG